MNPTIERVYNPDTEHAMQWEIWMQEQLAKEPVFPVKDAGYMKCITDVFSLTESFFEGRPLERSRFQVELRRAHV